MLCEKMSYYLQKKKIDSGQPVQLEQADLWAKTLFNFLHVRGPYYHMIRRLLKLKVERVEQKRGRHSG